MENNRLLTGEERLKCWDIPEAGYTKRLLEAQDRKSIKAVIEEIEKNMNLYIHADSNDVPLYQIPLDKWQHFKEGVLK